MSQPPTRDLTWPGLLAHWTAFAQSSLALPKNAEGQRWRDAVPAIIGLQAITHALGELDTLSPDEDRAVAQDRASVGIQTHTAALEQLWKGETLHTELATLIADARTALDGTRKGGVEWCVNGEQLVIDHPADLVDALIAAGFDGDLYLPVPGTVLFKHSPAAFARGQAGQTPEAPVTGVIREFLNESGGVGKHARAAHPRQVFRQFDFAHKRNGGVVRDVVCAMHAPAPGGQPQLVAAILKGQPQPVTLPIPGMANIDPVPLVVLETDALSPAEAKI